MKNLLKADFTRVLKDKLLIVLGILAVVFAVSMPLLYAVIFSSAGSLEEEMIALFVTAKAQFFGAFSIGNNFGLIAPVLLAIALCKDFSFGTIRNKVIAGKSRIAIYMSLFTTCATALIGIMLLHAFITLGVSLLFFDYQITPFTVSDFWYFLASLAFELLVLLFVSALLTYLCACMKNVGLVIVLYIAIALILVMAGSLIQVVVTILELTENTETLVSVLHFLGRINVGNAATYIGMGVEYTLEDVLYLTIPATVGILGFTGFGLLSFGKKDLK